MTKQEQLKFYKKALFHYIVSMIFPFMDYIYDTHDGFCVYFISKHQQYLFNLEELKKLKPKESYNSMYWFKYGHKLPRIKLLIKAIKNCKNETTI